MMRQPPDYLLKIVETAPKMRRRVARVFEVLAWIGLGLISLAIWISPLDASNPLFYPLVGFVLAFGVFNAGFFQWYVPRVQSLYRPFLLYWFLGVLLVAFLELAFSDFSLSLQTIYAVLIGVTGVLLDGRATVVLVATTILAHGSIHLGMEPDSTALTQEVLHSLGFIMVGLVGHAISLLPLGQKHVLERKNRNLQLLLEVSNITVSDETLEQTLQELAQKISAWVPVTGCAIGLVDKTGEAVVISSIHALRPNGWREKIGEILPFHTFGLMMDRLKKGEVLIRNVQHHPLQSVEPAGQDMLTWLLGHAQTLCVLPLIEQNFLGVLLVWEARSPSRSPLSQEKVNLLQTLANQLSVSIHNKQLQQQTLRQASSLALLNEVSQAIGSTLDLENLFELIYQQLRKVIPSDTYYVATYNVEDDSLDMHIMIDDSQRFPPAKIPLGKGFASHVVRQKSPFLVRHILEEWDSLPVRPVIMGTDRLSLSWLGVPVMLGDTLLGLLAIASYQPRQFSEADQELLCSVARQAALALDNARRHANVAWQAEHDSLTGAYNHGATLEKLRQSVQAAAKNQSHLSVMMIDIDDFKQYNDTYGHVVGDMVLVSTVQVFQECLPSAQDFIGRWGGEEFTIVLHNANVHEALAIARRIQGALSQLSLLDSAGQPVEKPTLSQGIACFPTHTLEPDLLVDIADKALYKAKQSGKDQIRLA